MSNMIPIVTLNIEKECLVSFHLKLFLVKYIHIIFRTHYSENFDISTLINLNSVISF